MDGTCITFLSSSCFVSVVFFSTLFLALRVNVYGYVLFSFLSSNVRVSSQLSSSASFCVYGYEIDFSCR